MSNEEKISELLDKYTKTLDKKYIDEIIDLSKKEDNNEEKTRSFLNLKDLIKHHRDYDHYTDEDFEDSLDDDEDEEMLDDEEYDFKLNKKAKIAITSVVSVLLASVIAISLHSCAKKDKAKNTNTTTTISTEVKVPEFVFTDASDDKQVSKVANDFYNSFDNSDVLFTVSDIEDVIRYLNGVKTVKTYTDIELLDLVDEVVYGTMNVYYGDAANTIGGVTEKKELNVAKFSTLLVDSYETDIIKLYDDYVEAICKDQTKEGTLSIAKEALSNEALLLFHELNISDKKISIGELNDGGTYLLYAIFDNMDRLYKSIGGNDFSVTLELVNDANDKDKKETETVTAEKIMEINNKKNCIITAEDGNNYSMDEQDAAMNALLDKQQSYGTLKLTY